jgi:hypothetical protein
MTAVTAEQLRRHIARYGAEGCEELAAALGVVLPGPKRRRRTTPTLRSQVLELRARGLVPEAIADALNISDRRCRSLLRSGAGHELAELAPGEAHG